MDPNSRLFFLGAAGSSVQSDEWFLAIGNLSELNGLDVNPNNGDIAIGGTKNSAAWFARVDEFGGFLNALESSDTSAGNSTMVVFYDTLDWFLFRDRRGLTVRNSTFSLLYDRIELNSPVYGFSTGAGGAVYSSCYNYILRQAAGTAIDWARSNPSLYYYYGLTVRPDQRTFLAIWYYDGGASYPCFTEISVSNGAMSNTYRGTRINTATYSIDSDANYLYLGGQSGSDAFIQKVTYNGSSAWAVESIQTLGTVWGVAVDQNGNVYAATQGGILMKFDSSGVLQWAKDGFVQFGRGRPIQVVGDYLYAVCSKGLLKIKTTTTPPNGNYGLINISDATASFSYVTSAYNSVSVSNSTTALSQSNRSQNFTNDPLGSVALWPIS